MTHSRHADTRATPIQPSNPTLPGPCLGRVGAVRRSYWVAAVVSTWSRKPVTAGVIGSSARHASPIVR
jgi:hypothetical protein